MYACLLTRSRAHSFNHFIVPHCSKNRTKAKKVHTFIKCISFLGLNYQKNSTVQDQAKWNETMEKYQFYTFNAAYFRLRILYLQVSVVERLLLEQYSPLFSFTFVSHPSSSRRQLHRFGEIHKSQIPRTKPQNTFINSFQKDTYRLRIFLSLSSQVYEEKKKNEKKINHTMILITL